MNSRIIGIKIISSLDSFFAKSFESPVTKSSSELWIINYFIKALRYLQRTEGPVPIASTAEMPNPSYREGMQNISAVDKSCGISVTFPRNTICFSNCFFFATSFIASIEPRESLVSPPANEIRKLYPFSLSNEAASISISCPFFFGKKRAILLYALVHHVFSYY